MPSNDQAIILTAILLPSTDSRRVVISYKQNYVHGVLVNHLAKGKNDSPDLTIAVDWDVKHQNKPKSNQRLVCRSLCFP